MSFFFQPRRHPSPHSGPTHCHSRAASRQSKSHPLSAAVYDRDIHNDATHSSPPVYPFALHLPGHSRRARKESAPVLVPVPVPVPVPAAAPSRTGETCSPLAKTSPSPNRIHPRSHRHCQPLGHQTSILGISPTPISILPPSHPLTTATATAATPTPTLTLTTATATATATVTVHVTVTTTATTTATITTPALAPARQVLE